MKKHLQALGCNFTKSNTPPWVFLDCTNGTKSLNASLFPRSFHLYNSGSPLHALLARANLKMYNISITS